MGPPTLRSLLSAVALAALASCGERTLPPSAVVLISLDACRLDRMSLYGYERETTPNLAALAEESLVFDRAYTTQPYTLSHMSLMTGLYPSQHGVVEGRALSHEVPTLAQRLRDGGHQTAALYHEGWIHARFGFDRGFEEFRRHWGAEQADRHLADVLDEADGRPLFLFVHLFDIHCGDLDAPGMPIYDPPPPYDSMFVPDARERLAGRPAREIFYDREPLTAEELEAVRALYDGAMAHVDAMLGSWIDEWRESGLLDRSLLVVTADHGEALGTRGVLRTHGGMWEEGLHVPLIVRFPDGTRAGERHAGLVSLVDVVPTVLAHAGVPADDWLPGTSVQEGRPEDTAVYAEMDALEVVLRGRWKGVRRQDGKRWDVTAYDLAADPGELQPLAGSERREALTWLIPAFRAKPLPPPFARPFETDGPSDEDLESLRALGYGE